jgi:two-component system CheB/CheR fusion protein
VTRECRVPNHPIDVLLIEDNPADARLLVESLRDAGAGDFNVHQVARLRAGLDYLSAGRADVVLLDLSLPDSSGLRSVEQLRAARPSIPIVVLTGLQDEELALEAVRRGVQDYLVKGQCEGALTAKSLRYAVERGRAEAAVRSAEEQLRTITDALPALVSYIDRDGYYRLNNRAYERWFGVSRADVAGKHMKDVLGNGTWEKVRLRFERALAGEEVRFEARLPYTGGGPRWVSGTYTPFRDPSGAVQGIVVLVNDITDRKAAEDVLRQSEERFSKAFSASPDALVISTRGDGVIREVNDSFLRLFGLRRHEAIGGRSIELGLFADPADRERVLGALRRQGHVRDFEVEVRPRGGGVRSVLLSAESLALGSEPCILTIIRDITERKRAEEDLRESESRSSLAQEAGGVGVFDWDVATGRSHWTAVHEAIYGLPPGTFPGTHRAWLERIHPDDRGPATQHLKAFFDERRRVSQMEYRIVRPGGEVRWVHNRGVATYDAGGNPLRVIGTTIDVTDRRRAEEAVRESEVRLRAIVHTAVDAIVTIDESGVIETVNPATEKMFGYGQAELLGRNINMLMPEPYRGEHDEYLAAYLRTGRPKIIGIGREVLGLRKDGSVFPLDLSVSEFSVGGRRMFTGIMHDISNRRRLEREVLEASTNEQRRIGHELHDGLCQQLTGIAFSTEILSRQLRDKAPDVMPRVQKLADEVDQTIAHARTLARGLNPVEIHAESFVSSLEDLARKVSETFGVSCRFRSDGDDTAVRDNLTASHLYRIAQEAISNAVRHGQARHIELTLRAGAGGTTLTVTDDGKGLAAGAAAARPHQKSEGIGLQTMAYRAKIINGILDVRPGPRRGVVVTCSIPSGASGRR